MNLVKLDCGDVPYYLEVDDSLLRSLSGELVVIQLPDGLKQFSAEIADCLESRYGLKTIIYMESTYGACDIAYVQIESSIRPAAILHLGHTPYPEQLAYPPYTSPRGFTKVIYIPVRYKFGVSGPTIAKAAALLTARGAKRVSVAVTAQHTNLYDDVVKGLEAQGLEVIRAKSVLPYFEEGQVIGCDYRVIPRNVDAYVLVGGGLFHAIGLYLSTLRPLVQLDPYRDEARDVTDEGVKYYLRRLNAVKEASSAMRWGIIIGLRSGQYRPWLVDKLTAALKSSGRSYRLLAAETVNEYVLRNVDSSWFQAFVVTACPRIPIDDLYTYEKPVLTPGEAFMALSGNLERYLFPW